MLKTNNLKPPNMHYPHNMCGKSCHAGQVCVYVCVLCVCILPRDHVQHSQRAAILYGQHVTGKPSAVR